MNDEESTLQAQMDSSLPQSEPLATETETSTDEAIPSPSDFTANEEEALASLEEGGYASVETTDDVSQEGIADTPLSADPLQDTDPDSGTSTPQTPTNGIDELRNELMQLRQELAARDAFFTRLGNEYDEFKVLYPNVSPEMLSDSIWKDVRRGIPLAAAYALAEKRRQHDEAQAERFNRENRLRSPGAVSGVEQEYFTPAEVRAMSRHEVRENYQKIVQSMRKWN